MADKKISELVSITGSATAADDYFVVVDTSGAVTYKISREELNNAIEQDVLSSIEITDITNDVNVQGTVTADGLTVENSSFPTLNINNASGTRVQLEYDTNNAIGKLRTTVAAPLVFETNNSERLRINSIGNVGIGTSSPVSLLTVDKGNVIGAGQWASSAIAIANPTNIGAYSQISFGYTPSTTNASAYIGYLSTNQGTNGYGDLVFGTRAVNTDTQPTERMRIDSSGNVGIGTTVISNKIALPIGQTVRIGATAGTAHQAGNVGSVGLTITDGGNANGVRVHNTHNGTYSSTDIRFTTGEGGVSIGLERLRILSTGGITFNGDTAQANALDDYEEGTWVPTIEGSTTNPSGISYSIQDGTYTKIGRMVYVMFRVRFSFTSGTGAGNLVIAGLPVSSTNYAQPKSPPQHDNLSFTGFEYLEMSANSNTATIGLAKNRSGSSASSLSLTDCNAGFTDINGGLFYFTS